MRGDPDERSPLREYDDTQVWLIAYLDDSKKNVFIINRFNGGFLTAIQGAATLSNPIFTALRRDSQG